LGKLTRSPVALPPLTLPPLPQKKNLIACAVR
jgi:hypothetical protein